MRRGQRGGLIFRLLALLTLAGLGALVYLLRHPLLRTAGEFWVVDQSPERADAILLLGDDNYPADRASRAAELYHAGWAPRVVASGRMLRRHTGLAELMERDLVERGVPADAVIRFSHMADGTHTEAQGLRRLVVERGWRRILLVTSNYHTRRAVYIFRWVFPPSVEVRVVAARDFTYDPDRWWESRTGRKALFLETMGFCLAMWEVRHPGSSPAEAHSPASAPAHPQD